MITYSFTFPILSCFPNNDGRINDITTIDWIFIGKDDTGYSHPIAGRISLDPPENGAPFVPFGAITKDMIESWVTTKLGQVYIDNMKQEIANRINDLVSPTIKDITPPWETRPIGIPVQADHATQIKEQLIWAILGRTESLFMEATNLRKFAYDIKNNNLTEITPEVQIVINKYDLAALADKIDVLVARINELEK